MRNSGTVSFLLFFILISSCSNNRLDIDVSGIKIEPVKIKRFEQDLFTKVPVSKLEQNYGDFLQGFVETIPGLCPNGLSDPACAGGIHNFISDNDMKAAYAACEKQYGDIGFLEDGITDAFRHFKYYFPDKSLPKVYTMMSGYNFEVLRLDKSIGIGLEMFLGSNYEYYSALQWPKYKVMNMTKDHILPHFVNGWLMTVFEDKTPKTMFLNQIVKEGKIMYLMDALLPKMNDTLKIGFTGKQLEWCKRNEANIWSFFIKGKVLFSTDNKDIVQYTNDGPFTTGFAKESPARTGSWIGWQIVRSYMEKNKNVTLRQLMDENDAQKLLSKAGYKPKL